LTNYFFRRAGEHDASRVGGSSDHQEGIADDETPACFTRLMDEGGAMLWGRVTYEMDGLVHCARRHS
jgi:hypothetical protein